MAIRTKRLFICRKRSRSLRDNGGYIIPLTLILLLFFTTLTLHATSEYIAEKQFFTLADEFRALETIVFFAVRDLEDILAVNQELSSGRLDYDTGFAIYKMEYSENEKISIALSCYTYGGAESRSILIYDVRAGTFVQWENRI